MADATNLISLLSDPSLLKTQAYLDGQFVDAASKKTFAVTNPARGDIIAEVADISRDEARAVSLDRLRERPMADDIQLAEDQVRHHFDVQITADADHAGGAPDAGRAHRGAPGIDR